MQVSKVGSPSWVGHGYGLKNSNGSVQNVSNPIINSKYNLTTDTVSFTQKQVIENLFIENLNNCNYSDSYKDFSVKLQEMVDNTHITQIVKSVNKPDEPTYVIENDNIGTMYISKNAKHKDIIPGVIVGKTGLYATLEVPGKKGNFVVIVPYGSMLSTESGLKVMNKRTDKQVAFTGSTCTVNAYYKPEKTINSVNQFIQMTETSPIFDEVKRSNKDYSEYFHPYILAGGFGSRLEAISHNRGDNKPSTGTPIPNWNLINFTLLNLYQANLLHKGTNIDFCVQKEANSAVGCFVTTLGYKIDMTHRGLDLVKEGESIVPPNKNVIIMPSDNITDVDLTEALDAFLARPDAGMMVVAVPDYRCYGGLILHNEKSEINTFITKPSKELLATGVGHVIKNGKVHKDPDGQETSLGNAFIYIIKPDVLDTITDIYRNKIRSSYQVLMATKGDDKSMTKEEYLSVIESFWDREIIPELVHMSNEGRLKGRDGQDLKVVSYDSLDADWSDVGEYSSYYSTIRNIAKEDSFTKLPKRLKQAVSDNIEKNVIFNADFKDDFKEFLGNGYVCGNVIVVAKN